ncbi:S8 family serine peptidase [Polaribacter haliotis]|uniref:S8 family serine peptidase n=1 Tax=Polaribacter haliotis TaxID=1888915 RepID=A0A7L8AIG2_9FLAO|nr:S8 family serine peptidase [Polaribacter haliotis]QOD61579.1 S8 family serine peptidase [Polaribacter haliotis]
MKKLLLLTTVLFAFSFVNAQDFSKTRLIVKYKETTNAKSKSSIQKILTNKNFKNSRSLSFSNNKKKSKQNNEILLFTFKDEIDVLKTANELKNTNLFEFVEPDYIGTGAGKKGTENFTTTPDDALFSRQWSLHNDGSFTASPSTNDADVDMNLAWDITTGNPDITIAVLDSGLRMTHPEMSGRVWVNTTETSNGLDSDTNTYIDDINGWDFVNNDNDPTDDNGHGTNIAGIIAATGNNSIGYAGVDWECKIMPLKILDQNNNGFYSNWIEAINYAVNKGAKIINMSVGGSSYSAAMETAVNSAHANGIVITVSMMNFNNSALYYPAAYANTIAVGSSDSDDKRSNPFFWSATSGSNFGNHIDVIAPGNIIFGLASNSDTNYNGYWGGTSQAAPLVAGICSLILNKKPNLTVEQIRTIIRESAEDMVGTATEDTAGWDQYYGAGRVNAFNALQKVLSTESFSTKNYRFYPNPTSDYLLMSTELNDVNYNLYNILGKNVLQGKISEGKIDLKTISKGIYSLKLQNGLESITKKIIKN